jgi:hypothetical protein
VAFRTHADRIEQRARENNLTPRQPLAVANRIQWWIEACAFEGISFSATAPADFKRLLDELVPIPRGRGIVRNEYDATTPRGNLADHPATDRDLAGSD